MYPIWNKAILLYLLYGFEATPKPVIIPTMVVKAAKVNKYDMLMKVISKGESNGVIDTINESGHLGKYQMSKSTLKHLGYKVPKRISKTKLDTSYFGNRVQDSLYIEYLKQLETRFLLPCFDKGYSREAVLYASGIGFMKVRRYFRTNGRINQSDGYGVTVRRRLNEYDSLKALR